MVPVGKVQRCRVSTQSHRASTVAVAQMELWHRSQIWGWQVPLYKGGMGVVGQRWVIIISATSACGGWGPGKSRTPPYAFNNRGTG